MERDAAVLEVGQRLHQQVAGHGEAEAGEGAALRVDEGGVDADELSVDIQERAAAVARVDRRVGLDEILVSFGVDARPAQRADDPGRDRLPDPKGIADCDHEITDLHLIGIPQRQRL